MLFFSTPSLALYPPPTSFLSLLLFQHFHTPPGLDLHISLLPYTIHEHLLDPEQLYRNEERRWTENKSFIVDTYLHASAGFNFFDENCMCHTTNAVYIVMYIVLKIVEHENTGKYYYRMGQKW